MTYHDIDIPLPFIAIDWICMTLALIPILLRFHLRRHQIQPQPFTRNLSDALIVLAWLSGIALISINTWKNSLRQRYIHTPPSDLYYGVPRHLAANLLYVSWISLFFIYISLWSAKFALLAFYASLLRLQGRWARVTLVCAAVFTAATFALHVALLTRWCTPTSSNWNIDGELCSAVHDIKSVTVSTAANVATDLAILCIPLFALASLRRDTNGYRKGALVSPSSSTSTTSSFLSLGAGSGTTWGKAELSGLAVVLIMAALSITSALARFITLELVQNVPKANITHTIDVWALVEIVASLLAVCLPSLRAFVRRWREGSKRGSRDSGVRKASMVPTADGSVRSDSIGTIIEMELGIGGGRLGAEMSPLSPAVLQQERAVPGRMDARRVDSGFLSVEERMGTAHTSAERLL
ncbi:hypothetical protein DIS24_g8218 [Lasiodiplodia hormozganensis]|uniref:Rhodopsin domain-containing protein n=1 Tax=Lasiodiplodia hormozganensis TaxID=869390 RepID=A0AA39Y320_9PEZI|nr:hypothetical protein DIS24_g8218 [Lasiodiplodia hormozganensis]